ncbi:uncharacterized protein FTJAE_10056 [Fusarium tjaetaba]|uniref:Heterokaryon incompatibility domain-containing protein n=1 Tax=Fusarium tjaetaba TaxID=1567544 RepID=A0A8H5VHW9_9HYPO|nr:uncharacterized protein FTJAE_10056 [Fusarium tjaetaba]KAF5625337.1 hypothetical protein FTJAE_10056 [Fusarium tjaetaba]
MPTRLLDLGDPNSNFWRLHQDPGHVPYAALSHRWSSDTPELHTSNYEKYGNFQPDTILPQSYQDVISICRAIPIQYLWIDSLCIIQDDNSEEFSKEAPLMRDIYQYAFLTLSICWDFPGVSLFRRCRPRSVPRPYPHFCQVEHNCGPVSDEWVFITESSGHRLRDICEAPVNRRAWVLQERYLSRRLLYLSSDQLYWECSKGIGSEVCPTTFHLSGERESIVYLTGDRKVSSWNSTLTEYTKSDLTFESDRLVAIAGLAKLIASRTGGTYLAGIWLESWMNGLLWKPGKKRSRSLNLKAKELTMVPPSWSWLAFPGSVKTGAGFGEEGPIISMSTPNSFESDTYWPLALLSQAIVIPSTSDPFSSFERAILKIRCLLMPVTFGGIPHRNEPTWFFRHERDVELSSVGLSRLRLRACEREHGKRCAIFQLHFSEYIDMSVQYFLVPLYIRHLKSLPNIKRWPHCYGLVLQELPGGSTREFIRVGIWSEEHNWPSQLIPMISNTIAKLDLKKSALSDGNLTENERVFDLKLHEYAIGHAASEVEIPTKVVEEVVEHQPNIEELKEKAAVSGSEADEQESNKVDKEEGPSTPLEVVECSLLPHFTTAEWGTISLV